MHNEAGVQVVMEEENEECGGFVWVDLCLRRPVRVGRFDPMEVVIGEHSDGLL